MKKLPIGISTLEFIRRDNYYYVDKTPFVKKLVDNGKYYFLSRPRRFGKSLFVDTLKQAFLGNLHLFEGTYLENNWNWEKKYPVIHLDLSKTVNDNVENFKGSLDCILQDIGEDYSIALEKPYPNLKFEELIKKLYKKYNLEVVVLVDEYDKPILDNIENIEKALEIREVLREFYSILKASDQYLKFVFLTGVSRFSKVSIFSGLNQLNDITLSPTFATICGYTQSELETVFKDRLEGVNLEELKYWYNGYSWLGEKVYNPFDVLLFLSEKIFRPYWFETGTPTFLMKLILNNKVFLPKLEEIKANDEILANLDVDFLKIENLFFQTGYLTIRETKKLGLRTIYILTYPNFEVKSSFNN
ncbi:AAA family ATPase, partial [Sulfurihydrogenibium azorense]|uniref:ATP-binding protein n=1 Tax=Sulfurihydrogenibium azorense TaxID=309806 RepID=UPI0024099F78